MNMLKDELTEAINEARTQGLHPSHLSMTHRQLEVLRGEIAAPHASDSDCLRFCGLPIFVEKEIGGGGWRLLSSYGVARAQLDTAQ